MRRDMRVTGADVIVAGAGVLGREVCMGLARLPNSPLSVAVMARSSAAAEELSFTATSCARAARSDTSFHPMQIDFTSADAVERAIAACRPSIVVGCVSHHSPWEAEARRSAWTELVSSAGFGVTLPLQWAFTAAISRAVSKHASNAIVLNGCFPDAVNVALRRAALPVFCGIGNIASLAAAAKAELGIGDNEGLRMLAHHRHLSTPRDASEDAVVWLNDEPISNVPMLLRRARAIPRKQLCVLAGAAAAALIRAILWGTAYATHAPGPGGLPGGYPIRVRSTQMKLDLPHGVSETDAITWNERAATADGVVISGAGEVAFSPAAQCALRAHACELASGFRVSELGEACAIMLKLRERLRQLSG